MLLYFIFKLCIFIIKKLLNFLTKDHSNSKIIYWNRPRTNSPSSPSGSTPAQSGSNCILGAYTTLSRAPLQTWTMVSLSLGTAPLLSKGSAQTFGWSVTAGERCGACPATSWWAATKTTSAALPPRRRLPSCRQCLLLYFERIKNYKVRKLIVILRTLRK